MAGVIRVKQGGVVVGGMVGGLQAQGRCFFRSDRPIIQNLYNQTSVYFMLFVGKIYFSSKMFIQNFPASYMPLWWPYGH